MRARPIIVFVTVLGAIFLLEGCPWFKPRFTSADLGGARRSPVLDTMFGAAPEGDNTGGGAAEERELVEPDVIRQDGHLLYVLNQYRGLTIVDLRENRILSQAPTYGFPRDLYVRGGRAYVLVAYAADYEVDGNTVSFDIASRLYVVDVSVPESAHIIGEFELEGDFVDSRLVGDVVYAVAAEFTWYWDTPVAIRKQTSNTWVTSINVADPGAIFEADTLSFPGSGTVIQATSSAIFAAAPDYGADTTRITYVDISDPGGALETRGSVSINGHVADRYKMDAYGGVLRVVSNTWGPERRVLVSTVDLADADNLVKLAELEVESAAGDTLFAARFDGDTAYLFTFFMVDPLHVIDLRDPAHPAETSFLEVPGWATHIEPMGDYLIALGVDNTEGRRVSVSLYNVADPANPALVEQLSFGEEWGWSTAYDDVKAFTVLDNLILLPFSGWDEARGAYDRLQFITWSPTELEARGYVDVQGGVVRSFEDEGQYFAVTAEQLVTISADDLDTPSIARALVLAEDVADFVELTPDRGLEILSRADTQAVILRLVGLPLKAAAAGELELNIGVYRSAHLFGATLAIVGAGYGDDYKGFYEVALVDVGNTAGLRLIKQLRVAIEPYYEWYPWYIYPAADAGVAKMIAPPWIFPFPSDNAALQVDNLLILRGFAERYDRVIGAGPATQGYAAIDIEAGEWVATIGFAFDVIDSLNAVNGSLVLGTASFAGYQRGQPLTAHYLRTVEPLTGEAGPAANVPGTFLQYDPVTDVLLLRDYQWDNYSSVAQTIRAARWDGASPVTPLDSHEVDAYTGQIVAAGAKVYLDGYSEGYSLSALSVGADGALDVAARVLVTEQWGSLLAARGDKAYASVGGGAIAVYDFSAAPALEALVPVMGAPTRIRFGETGAYAPLGYFGVTALP